MRRTRRAVPGRRRRQGAGRQVAGAVALVDDRRGDPEADEQEADWASPTRVARILKRLRLKQADRTAKQRGWILSVSTIQGLAHAYGLVSSSTDDPDGSEGRPDPQNTESQAAPPEDSVTGDTSVTSVIDDVEFEGESEGEDEREQFEL